MRRKVEWGGEAASARLEKGKYVFPSPSVDCAVEGNTASNLGSANKVTTLVPSFCNPNYSMPFITKMLMTGSR